METSATTTGTITASNYASFGQRFLAWLIDAVMIWVVQMIVVTPILAAAGIGLAANIPEEGLSEEQALGAVGGMMAMAGTIWIAVIAIVVLYYSFMESSKLQASVGKL